MPLLTISDLDQPEHVLEPFIKRAEGLSDIYMDYIAKDPGGFKYEVEITGERSRASGIHASEMSKCQRRVVYSVMNTERKPDPSTTDVNMKMRFRLGGAVHAMLQNDWHRIAASRDDMTFKDEVGIYPSMSKLAAEHDIHSSCDGEIVLLTDGTPEVRVGLEIKTASPKEYEKLKAPQPDHLEQTTLYMACLDLPIMWVLYYNKGNSNFTTSFAPFLFRFDPDIWHRLEMRFVKDHHLAELSQLPAREEGFHCKWCPFSYTCQPSGLQKKPQRLGPGMLGGKR